MSARVTTSGEAPTRAELMASAHRVWAEYAHRIDDGSATAGRWSELFTEDAVMEVRGAVMHGRAEILGYAERTAPARSGRHLVVNIEMEISADTTHATVVSDFLHLSRVDDVLVIDTMGRYRSTLRREGDRWLIATHAVDID